MDNERIQTQGRLAEAQKRAGELEVRIKAFRESIRAKLDPWADIMEMDAQSVPDLAFELARLHTEYMGLKKQILAMKKALGIRQ
jgi:hypothetical protein